MTEEATKRVRSSGVMIGKAIEKLEELQVEEAAALAQSPADIKARFAKRREKVLEQLDAGQRKKVEAALAADLERLLGPTAEAEAE